MVKIIFYTTMKEKELKFDTCYGLCDEKQRKECDKNKLCMEQLCGNDELSLAGYSIYASKTDLNKVEKAVKLWRKKMFKKCNKFLSEIRLLKHNALSTEQKMEENN